MFLGCANNLSVCFGIFYHLFSNDFFHSRSRAIVIKIQKMENCYMHIILCARMWNSLFNTILFLPSFLTNDFKANTFSKTFETSSVHLFFQLCSYVFEIPVAYF